MVTFLLCQSCVARIAPSLSPAVLDILMMVGGLSVWLTRGGNEGFLPVLCAGGWAWRDPRLSCAETPPPSSFCSRTHALFVSGNESIGNVGVLWAGISVT